MTTITKQATIEAVKALKSGDGSRDGWTRDAALDDAIAALNALPAVTVTDDMAHRAQQKLRIHVGSSLIFPSINEVRAALEAALNPQ